MISNPGYTSETGTHLKTKCNFFRTCEQPVQKVFGPVCRIYSEKFKNQSRPKICPLLIKLLHSINPYTFNIICNFRSPDQTVVHLFHLVYAWFHFIEISFSLSLSASFYYTKTSANKINHEVFNYLKK
jgi:hypothetical protein